METILLTIFLLIAAFALGYALARWRSRQPTKPTPISIEEELARR